MSGTLQTRIYGAHKHSSTHLKKMGHTCGPSRKMGHYNNSVKKLGSYNGVGSSKNNLNAEVYPHY